MAGDATRETGHGTVAVSEAGIAVAGADVDRRLLHVSVDGRRVWSFRPADHVDDTDHSDRSDHADQASSLVAWPRDLRLMLVGTSVFAVHDAAGRTVAEARLHLGGSSDPVRVEDSAGNLLVVGANQRLVRTFETQDRSALNGLMDALETVLAALQRGGVDAFPAYGTLLGAVRSGRVIGHDDDADVGYLSRHTHPADVIAESYALQRLLHGEGLTISRYSGAAFKVEVDVGSGVPVGLDVFAGFFYGDRLCLMGELFDPVRREWLLPLGTVELEGRTLPAPAQPDRLLELIYGPSWRVPDPTFTHHRPDSTQARLDGWFRGTRTYRNLWDRRYSTSAERGPWTREPHKLARLVHRKEPGRHVVELGCGRGQDAVWLAARGHRVTALDYSPNGFQHLAGRAAEADRPIEFHAANLLETRQVVSWAARLGAAAAPRTVLARHLLDATSARGAANVWRLARTLLRDGGRLYAEFMAADPFGEGRPDLHYLDGLVSDLDVAQVRADAEAAGGRVLVARILEARAFERPSPVADDSPEPRKCRMVVEWAP